MCVCVCVCLVKQSAWRYKIGVLAAVKCNVGVYPPGGVFGGAIDTVCCCCLFVCLQLEVVVHRLEEEGVVGGDAGSLLELKAALEELIAVSEGWCGRELGVW